MQEYTAYSLHTKRLFHSYIYDSKGENELNHFMWILILLLVACSNESVSFPKGFENASGYTLLAEGLQKHEAGEFELALEFFDAAYFQFSQQNIQDQMAETLTARSLTLRRQNKLPEAKKALEKAVELTRDTGGVVLPLYNLAKVQEEMSDVSAVETYRQALEAMELYQPAPHYREAVVNDMKLHLALAELFFERDTSGDAEERALAAIEALLGDEKLDAFGKMVWVSGGYLGLSRYYRERDAQKAWFYFDQAEEIITTYPSQDVLRRQDREALRQTLPPRS